MASSIARFLGAGLLFTAGALRAQTIDTLERILSMEYAFPLAPECKDAKVKAFFKAVRDVRNDWLAQQRITGKTSLAANGDFQPRNDFFKMNGSFELTRGTFPSQFRVKAGVGVTLQNGALQENISDLSISYDYHPRAYRASDTVYCTAEGEITKAYLARENYAYMSRFTDNFMRIDQRYEIGFGTLFAHWSSVLTRKGKDWETNHKTVKDCDCNGNGAAAACLKKLAGATGNAPLSDAAIKALREASSRSLITARKKYATVRYGMLLGLMGEMERTAAFTDSLWTDTMLTAFTAPSTSLMRFRYVVRPFIDLRPTDRFELSLRPYFVLPAPWDWLSSVPYKDRNGQEFLDERVDWRADVRLRAAVTLTNMDDQSNTEVTVGVNYRMWYDNAPNRRATDSYDEQGFQQLVVAPEVHNQFMFELTIKL